MVLLQRGIIVGYSYGFGHLKWSKWGDLSRFMLFFFYPLPICKVQKLRITLLRLKINTVVSSIQDTPGLLFLDSDGSIIYFNLPVTIETYLLGLFEHLKCGYCFDVINLGQLLENKRNGMKSQFWYPLSGPTVVLGDVSGGMSESPGTADTLQILLPRTFLIYPQSFQECYSRKMTVSSIPELSHSRALGDG